MKKELRLMEAQEIFKETLEWMKNDYHNPEHRFFKERDIVWVMQKHLLKIIEEKRLPYKVLNDYTMRRKGRHSVSCDLVIMRGGDKLLAIEFKYEPDHNRIYNPIGEKQDGDIYKGKFPVVSWKSIIKDMERVTEFVSKDRWQIGLSIFVDEGAYYKKKNPSPKWDTWGNDVPVLISWVQ